MKKLRWQILVVILTLVVVGILLLTQQPGLNPILPQAASGGIYTEGLVGSFGRLNPILDLNNPADRDIDRLLFSALFKFDSRGIPQPDLAESWGVTPDGTIYNVTIRAEAVWHDGQPVTTQDVLFTLSLLRSQYSAYPADVRALWDEVEVTLLSDKTIKFKLAEPFVPFLDYLTFGVLPKHLLENVPADQIANADFNLKPVGSGPYRFDRLVVENSQVTGVVLAGSENYYGKSPFVQQIVFRYYPTAQTAMDAYQQGEVLGLSQVTTDILPAALIEKNLALYSSRLPKMSIILFNLKNTEVAFFQEKNVRRALMLGLNRQWMVDTYLHSQAIVADSPILPGTWAYYAGVPHIDYDPDAAIALLKAESYVLPADGTLRAKESQQLTFTLLYPDDELHAKLAQSIQRDWAIIGVQVNLQAVSFDSLLNDYLIPRDYQAALVELDLSRSPDPDPYPFWHQSEATGGQNYSQWDNRTASEYLEQARVLVDMDIRARLYRNFQSIFAKELPALPLYYPVYTYGVDVRMRGVQLPPLFEPSDRFNNVSDWYLVTRREFDQTSEPTAAP
ncbi:MAG: peptide ABC transporter substrate-binding protein [Anaerolineales bacterium]|nr:peptide ABC transporter substrate-binding protein [Anaerolineales bacterium]